MMLNRIQHATAILSRARVGYFVNRRTQTLKPHSEEIDKDKLARAIGDAAVNVTSEDRDLEHRQELMPMTPRSPEGTKPFDDVPGPKVLKFMAAGRHYFSQLGTQITARLLTLTYNIGTARTWGYPYRHLKYLFDEYGPVVRFIGPLGGDIVLTNSPRHIASVFAQEGQYPVRSALDSLHKYRMRRTYRALSPFTGHGDEWNRQRCLVSVPLHTAPSKYCEQLWSTCQDLTDKIYSSRNTQDELDHNLYIDLHKWAFDCMSTILLPSNPAPQVTDVLGGADTDSLHLYGALTDATTALMHCEGGLQLWKLFETPSWRSLVEKCDNLESLIGKHVNAAVQDAEKQANAETDSDSLINTMMKADNVTKEDAVTILMDMLVIGVNTTASAMGFLLYNLARSQKAQRQLYNEISDSSSIEYEEYSRLKLSTPYLQACIKETLRLFPPIPVLTRVLPKSIVLDQFNIPRGTLVIMSTQDSSLKESNFDDADRFLPDRWLGVDSKEYDAFASIPFGFGARKCVGQGVAEAAMIKLTITLLQKYKLEYHYGDISPTPTFIARPNKPLRIRFTDRRAL